MNNPRIVALDASTMATLEDQGGRREFEERAQFTAAFERALDFGLKREAHAIAEEALRRGNPALVARLGEATDKRIVERVRQTAAREELEMAADPNVPRERKAHLALEKIASVMGSLPRSVAAKITASKHSKVKKSAPSNEEPLSGEAAVEARTRATLAGCGFGQADVDAIMSGIQSKTEIEDSEMGYKERYQNLLARLLRCTSGNLKEEIATLLDQEERDGASASVPTPSIEADSEFVDRHMGVEPANLRGVHRERGGRSLVLGVMSPREAAAHLARLQARGEAR
jgi:hypothetical protein